MASLLSLGVCYDFVGAWVVFYQGGMLGQPAKHQLERHTTIYVLHGVGGLDGPGCATWGFIEGSAVIILSKALSATA